VLLMQAAGRVLTMSIRRVLTSTPPSDSINSTAGMTRAVHALQQQSDPQLAEVIPGHLRQCNIPRAIRVRPRALALVRRLLWDDAVLPVGICGVLLAPPLALSLVPAPVPARAPALAPTTLLLRVIDAALVLQDLPCRVNTGASRALALPRAQPLRSSLRLLALAALPDRVRAAGLIPATMLTLGLIRIHKSASVRLHRNICRIGHPSPRSLQSPCNRRYPPARQRRRSCRWKNTRHLRHRNRLARPVRPGYGRKIRLPQHSFPHRLLRRHDAQLTQAWQSRQRSPRQTRPAHQSNRVLRPIALMRECAFFVLNSMAMTPFQVSQAPQVPQSPPLQAARSSSKNKCSSTSRSSGSSSIRRQNLRSHRLSRASTRFSLRPRCSLALLWLE